MIFRLHIKDRNNKNGIYNITLQGANYRYEKVFGTDECKEKFIQILGLYKRKCGYKVYAYCIMDDRAHILLKEGHEIISETITKISTAYIYWYSAKYRRCGQVFYENPECSLIKNDADLMAALKQIHQNPSEIESVRSVEEYQWSSCYEHNSVPKIVDEIDLSIT